MRIADRITDKISAKKGRSPQQNIELENFSVTEP